VRKGRNELTKVTRYCVHHLRIGSRGAEKAAVSGLRPESIKHTLARTGQGERLERLRGSIAALLYPSPLRES
jgi:hypothetical protein